MQGNKRILVFGATGQQGGSVAQALVNAGWSVTALVRSPESNRAVALKQAGVKLVQGGYDDVDSIRTAMKGAYGVFSVQQSSPSGSVTDDEEIRAGISIADIAVASGVTHFVYSSGGAVSDKPTGLGHFDSKMCIEKHIRGLPLQWTILRPVTFIDMLTMPGFGLAQGQFNFLMHPDQSIQLLAVEDIGKFVEPIFSHTARFAGETIEIASDAVTGSELGELFSQTANRPIRYARFSAQTLAASPFLAKLTALFDEGPLAGHADLEALRQIHPNMLSIRQWLSGTGKAAFLKALESDDSWQYDRSQ